MKKRAGAILLTMAGIAVLSSCGAENEKASSQAATSAVASSVAVSSSVASSEETEEKYYDVEVNADDPYDHYFSNTLRFSDMNTSISKDSAGNYAGSFITEGVAKMSLKSITDGDTAVFYLNNESDTYTVAGKSYSYVTIRFTGIDTPESTSSIDPWGKAASNYAKSVLKNAEGWIVDASDYETDASRNYAGRLDSNGTRWLGVVWYCPQGQDPQDLSTYRCYQLDLIEECYSEGVYFESERNAYTASKTTEPILYSRYTEKDGEKRYGSIRLGELFYETGNRMSKCSKELRVHGEIDPNYDYSKNPTSYTITEALSDEHRDTIITRGTYVELTGVITRYVSNNFYMCDEQGTALYVYMGIEGNSISTLFQVGDTIKIRGRLCEYGGQYQMSGVVFKSSTFTKVTGDDAIAMPEVIDLDQVAAADLTEEYVRSILGQIVTKTITVKSGSVSLSKDNSYSFTDASGKVEGMDLTGSSYSSDGYLQVRVNGTLSPNYDILDYANYNSKTGKYTFKDGTYKVTGIMGIYQEEDYTKSNVIPSYQIVIGNRDRTNADGTIVNEIVAVS